jgi:hypothetical protein
MALASALLCVLEQTTQWDNLEKIWDASSRPVDHMGKEQLNPYPITISSFGGFETLPFILF